MSVLRLRCDHFVVYHYTPLEACVSSADDENKYKIKSEISILREWREGGIGYRVEIGL